MRHWKLFTSRHFRSSVFQLYTYYQTAQYFFQSQRCCFSGCFAHFRRLYGFINSTPALSFLKSLANWRNIKKKLFAVLCVPTAAMRSTVPHQFLTTGKLKINKLTRMTTFGVKFS